MYALFARISWVNWIGHVNKIDSKRRESQLFNNNPRGDRLRGRPKNGWWNCVRVDINGYKIKNLKVRSRNRAHWEKSIKDGKVLIGLYCHQRR
jgi:hypothetical protein